jgi:hypothetical protein
MKEWPNFYTQKLRKKCWRHLYLKVSNPENFWDNARFEVSPVVLLWIQSNRGCVAGLVFHDVPKWRSVSAFKGRKDLVENYFITLLQSTGIQSPSDTASNPRRPEDVSDISFLHKINRSIQPGLCVGVWYDMIWYDILYYIVYGMIYI